MPNGGLRQFKSGLSGPQKYNMRSIPKIVSESANDDDMYNIVYIIYYRWNYIHMLWIYIFAVFWGHLESPKMPTLTEPLLRSRSLAGVHKVRHEYFLEESGITWWRKTSSDQVWDVKTKLFWHPAKWEVGQNKYYIRPRNIGSQASHCQLHLCLGIWTRHIIV